MSDKTLAEILAERRAQLEGRGEQIDAEVEQAETGGTRKKKKPKKKPTPPPVEEQASVGRDFAAENARRLMQQLDAQYEAAKRAGNVDLANKIDARRKALAETVQ